MVEFVNSFYKINRVRAGYPSFWLSTYLANLNVYEWTKNNH